MARVEVKIKGRGELSHTALSLDMPLSFLEWEQIFKSCSHPVISCHLTLTTLVSLTDFTISTKGTLSYPSNELEQHEKFNR